jgi:hypothetical protein
VLRPPVDTPCGSAAVETFQNGIMQIERPARRGLVCTTAGFGPFQGEPPLEINNLRNEKSWIEARIREVGLYACRPQGA